MCDRPERAENAHAMTPSETQFARILQVTPRCNVQGEDMTAAQSESLLDVSHSHEHDHASRVAPGPLHPRPAADDTIASQCGTRESLSAMLWSIDWASHLPVSLGDGVAVRLSNFDECVPFVREHYARIFHEEESSPFTQTREEPGKERYYRIAGDFFALELDGKTIGLVVCTPSDWSTYYIRSAAVLPEHLGKGLVVSFLRSVFQILRAAGVERVEADTAPSNLVVMRALTSLSFNVTGTVLTDRWGALVHLTRYLAEDREDVFLRQFCSGIRWQQQGRSHPSSPDETRKESP
jgi:RimJ/RimL family protein N-acetyltransferase